MKFQHSIINMTPLHGAIQFKNAEIVKILLSKSEVDFNSKLKKKSKEKVDELTSLYIATEKGDIEIVQLFMLQQKIDVNLLSSKKSNEN